MIGGALVAALLVHVGGPWIANPPDMLNALLLRSPTLFTPVGVVAMWAMLAAALLTRSGLSAATGAGAEAPARWLSGRVCGAASQALPPSIHFTISISGGAQARPAMT